MPSSEPLPTIRQLVKAGSDAITGEGDTYGDTRSGSLYNHTLGPFAILCSREADRDLDQFRAIYFADADGWPLTRMVAQRMGVQRELDTYGNGTCSFARPTSSGGAGSFLQGTRVQIPGAPPVIFQVAADTPVSATALSATVPIAAMAIGSGNAASATSGLQLLDPVYDSTWTPTSLACADGTDFEPAPGLRARALAQQAAARSGYLANMVSACQAAGATYVLAFPSTYGLDVDDFADDFGLNAIYVADANYQSSPALINACSVALESWRVGGADLWVGGVSSVPLSITMLVALTDAPNRVPLLAVRRACAQALLGAFGAASSGFSFSPGALTGAVSKASPYVQLASLPSVWAEATLYATGAVVVPSPQNGQTYQCAAGGETGIVQPNFPAVAGASVPDGSLLWQCTPFPGLGIYAAGALLPSSPSLVQGSFPAVLSRYTLSSANIAFQFTGPV